MSTAMPPPQPASLSRHQKVAVVLLAIGPDKAARVLEHMSEQEQEQVAVEIAQLGQLDAKETTAVLEELRTEAHAAEYLVSGGVDHARNYLRALHGAAADDIVDRLLANFRAQPFHFLQAYDAAEVLQQLQEENPQTLALVLTHLPARFGAQILSGLEGETQSAVATRIAQIERSDPAVVSRVEDAVRRRFGEVRGRGEARQGGVEELAGLLNSSDRPTEKAILGKLQEVDPNLAEEVRALMFVFEDIVQLDDRAVQEVLRQADLKRLAYALKGTSETVRDKIFNNLSERASETLAEEVDLLGPVPLSDVGAAQTEVVALIRRLEDEGTITTSRGGEGQLVE